VFTGIVERTAVVRVARAGAGAGGLRLGIAVEPDARWPRWRGIELGESIAIDGVCLTVAAFENRDGGGVAEFDAVPETLATTTIGARAPGDRVNVERALRAGDSFGGHYVTGHVDGQGVVSAREPDGEQVLFTITAPATLVRQMLPKGSITVDGVSLTLVDVDRSAGCFTFAAIPHTLERTTLGERAVGAAVNLETDAFGKWVLHALDASGLGGGALP